MAILGDLVGTFAESLRSCRTEGVNRHQSRVVIGQCLGSYLAWTTSSAFDPAQTTIRRAGALISWLRKQIPLQMSDLRKSLVFGVLPRFSVYSRQLPC